MKVSTASKLQEYSQSDKIQFNIVDTGIDVTYTLTDEEILELVELEYGQTLQSVVELFKCILRDTIKLAVQAAKEDRGESEDGKVPV